MQYTTTSADMTQQFGKQLGSLLRGGEVLELVGDVGAGKTTFTKGLASGLAITDDVQSPTFTISRVYSARDGLELMHYDFYRLSDPGILKLEVDQAVHDTAVVTVVEWGDIIQGVLPDDRLTIRFQSPDETVRQIDVTAGGPRSQAVLEGIEA